MKQYFQQVEHFKSKNKATKKICLTGSKFTRMVLEHNQWNDFVYLAQGADSFLIDNRTF